MSGPTEKDCSLGSTENPPPPQQIMLPEQWYIGGHGDPIARFDPKHPVVLSLHHDGMVTWHRFDG